MNSRTASSRPRENDSFEPDRVTTLAVVVLSVDEVVVFNGLKVVGSFGVVVTHSISESVKLLHYRKFRIIVNKKCRNLPFVSQVKEPSMFEHS